MPVSTTDLFYQIIQQYIEKSAPEEFRAIHYCIEVIVINATPSPGTLLVTACAGLLVGTSLVHSLVGERRLIGPLLTQRDGVLRSDLARFLLRAVWHFMTLHFWMFAAVLIASVAWEQPLITSVMAVLAVGIGGLARSSGGSGMRLAFTRR